MCYYLFGKCLVGLSRKIRSLKKNTINLSLLFRKGFNSKIIWGCLKYN